MTEEQSDAVVRDLKDLVVGDMIEAWHQGRRYNRGRVLQTVPSLGMFWILDTGSGTRKLVDFESLLVLRVPGEERQLNPSVA